jgi:hypothetical protein
MNYETIITGELLLQHLKTENNIYTQFILEKMESLPENLEECEKHHIIPRHAGGTDKEFNLIILSVEDHKRAHELRYEAYGESKDALALRFWKYAPLNSKEAKRIRALHCHQVCKAKGIAFYSSEQQSKSGKKGGAVKSEEKIKGFQKKLSPAVEEKIRSGTVWTHPDLENELIVQPNQVTLVVDFQKIFAEALGEKANEATFVNLTTSSFSSGVAKVLKGERNSCWKFKLIRDRIPE